MFASRPATFQLLAVVMIVCISIGCSTLTTSSLSNNLDQPVTENPLQQASVQAESVETCVVHVTSYAGKGRRLQVPITDGMTVQDIVQAVKVRKLFARINIELQRPVANSHKPLKMPVTVDGFGKRVNPAYNYAIRSGDVLVISEDPSNTFDDMLDGVLSPLGISSSR
ncbi:MAG TPA: hypothetical protein EYN70_02415 [Planctomycetaceae bacterium]|nr:hypothetical protein [Planctomycetaceae bacterium]